MYVLHFTRNFIKFIWTEIIKTWAKCIALFANQNKVCEDVSWITQWFNSHERGILILQRPLGHSGT